MKQEENKKDFSESVRGFYNHICKNKYRYYSDWKWFRTRASRAQFNQTKGTLKKVLMKKHYKNALEIGPGDGIWTLLFTNYCDKIEAVDISENMLIMAKQRLEGKKVKLIHSNFLTCNLTGGKDLIYSIRCFEYLPEKIKVINKMYSLLNKGGELIIITKNPSFLKLKKEDPWLHSKQIDILTLKYLLEKRGFKNVEIYPAIFGKGFHFPILRPLSNYVHHRLLRKNHKTISFVLKHLTESFLIYVKK